MCYYLLSTRITVGYPKHCVHGDGKWATLISDPYLGIKERCQIGFHIHTMGYVALLLILAMAPPVWKELPYQSSIVMK